MTPSLTLRPSWGAAWPTPVLAQRHKAAKGGRRRRRLEMKLMTIFELATKSESELRVQPGGLQCRSTR